MSAVNDSPMQRIISNAWLGAILAVLELVLGFAMLSFPFLLGTAAVWVTGFMLVFIACVNVWHVITRKGHRWWSLLSAVLYGIVGLVLLLMPVASMVLLTLIIGLALVIGGILRFVIAITMRTQEGSAWRFFNAIVSLVLGGMVLWSWPASSVWLIGTIIAIEMIFSGWSLLFLSLSPTGNKC